MDSSAEDALAQLARDLVEEISAGRALELAADPEQLELAMVHVRPFTRLQRTRSGRQIPEVVHAHTELRQDLPHPGALGDRDIPQASWLKGQAEWKAKGEAIWAAHRWKDIHPGAADKFTGHIDRAHQHLSDPEAPALSKGYEALHEAHRTATEQLLPRAETEAQKASVREGISHIQGRLKEIDKAASVKSTRTSRLTGAVPERSQRAAEKIAEGDQHPQVQVHQPVRVPPPPAGARAVHPQLGARHVTPLAGDTMSGLAHKHMAQPFPVEAPSAEATALEQANRRLDQYAKREEAQRQSDLRDHIGELRRAEQEMRQHRAAVKGQATAADYQPLTDEQYQMHTQDVAAKLHQALAKGQATVAQHSTDGGYAWTPQRTLAHTDILQQFLAQNTGVPSRRQALLMGGLAGAGKSTVLKAALGAQARDYAHVNSDYFKEELAKRGMVPEVAGLSPLESSSLIHEESSYLADQAARLLRERGKNIAYDMAMSSPEATHSHIDQMDRSGYDTHAIFVDTPVEKALQRSASRHRQGHESYRQGANPLGGRYLPPELIRSAEVAPGVTRNQQAFEQVKPRLASWKHYDNSGRTPRLVDQSATPMAHGIPSVEELMRRQPYIGSTEAQARAAEKGQLG